MKDYAGARDAYGTTKDKYPFKSWCGNEQAAYQYRYAFIDGLCLEHLGRRQEALSSYYEVAFATERLYFSPVVHYRIMDMYDSSGQQGALFSLLDEIDEHFLSMLRKEGHESEWDIDPKALEDMRPTTFIRRIQELRQFAKEGRRSELIALLKLRGVATGPPDDSGNWEALEAAQLLALTPEASTKELLAEIDEGDRSDRT